MYTTDCNYFRITNYNTVQQGYYRWTGCTDVISVTPINPLDSHFVCAKDLMVEDWGAPLDVVFVGLCPSSTPTPTITPTPTLTPVTPTPTPSSPTPTQTPTPTITPTLVYTYNLWTGGYYQNVCQSINFGTPVGVTIYTTKPFASLVPGDYVYGNSSLSIPPVGAGFTISDGARFIQASGNLVINVGICA
jgi:hypothetical protein